MSRVAPTLAAPAPPEASPSDGGVEMEAPAPSPRFADAQAVDDERFVGDSSWWACLSEWFRSEQGDGPESCAQLRKEVRLLKRENAALRELARARGATSEEVARARAILEPPTPAQAVATLYGDAEGGWAAAATSSGSVVSAGDSASGDVLVDGVPVAVAPNPLVVVSDAGRTVDDELALVLLRAFAERGLVQPTAVVANVSPALARARLARGTLDTLGLYHVPVGVGTDGGGGEDCVDTWSETADQYVPGEQSQAAKALMSGRRLLHRTFVRARPGSLTLLLLSSTKDAALFLRDNTDLFKAKIRVVVVSGGCAVTDAGLAPDASAHNVAVDAASADFLFRRLQELRVPLVVVGRHAAAAAKTPKRVFDQLAELGSPIGWRLRSATRDAVLAEWAACRDDDVQRVAFLKRACGCADVPATEDDVWPFATAFETRDAVALCCCVPELRSRFFEPTSVSCQGCDHLVVGCEPAASCVKPDPELLFERFLEQSYQHGISLNSSLCRPEIIVVSDPGQDLDDEMAFVLLRALIEEGLVSCAGVVCNLRPAGRRALLARGTLDCLGLQHVPVAAGSDGGSKKHEDTFSDSAAHYMPEKCELPDGQALLKELYENAPLGGVHLLLISSMTDAARFVRENERLFVDRTTSVTIMGGVEAFDAADGKPLKPDTANNNTFDMAAAEELYANIQRLRVPMVVLSRHAAYACPMPRDVYDDLSWTGHPIGQRLQSTQRASIEGLWKRAAASDPEKRMGLPARCDKPWFCNTFCAGKGGDRTEDDSVWDLVVSFNMYDPLALMACVPDLRRRFFRCVEKRVDGVAHSVIGTSKDAPGVDEENVRPLRDFMYRGFFKGATLNFSSYTKLDADTMPTRLRDLAREVASVALDPAGKKAPDEVKDDADERKEPR